MSITNYGSNPTVQVLDSATPATGDAAIALVANFKALSDQCNALLTAVNAALAKASNLADLQSASAARTNLGLGSAATANTSAFDASGAASTVQGNLNTHVAATGTAVHGLGTASTHPASDFDTSGAAATVNSALTTHVAATGTAVHGLGTASTYNVGDFDASGSAATVNTALTSHTSATAAHSATGAVVGTTNTQTLTNKSISGSSNTLSNIPESAVTSLTSDLALKAPIASPTFTGTVTAPTFSGALTGHASLDLPLTGGTLSGALAMGGNNLTGAGSITTSYSTLDDGSGNATIAGGLSAMSGQFMVNANGSVGVSGPYPGFAFADWGGGSLGTTGFEWYSSAGIARLFSIADTTDRLTVDHAGNVTIGGLLTTGNTIFINSLAGQCRLYADMYGGLSIYAAGVGFNLSTAAGQILYVDGSVFYIGVVPLVVGGKATIGGLLFPQQAVTASAPTYVLGGLYFDTTLNKLRVGGASGWETVTSV